MAEPALPKKPSGVGTQVRSLTNRKRYQDAFVIKTVGRPLKRRPKGRSEKIYALATVLSRLYVPFSFQDISCTADLVTQQILFIVEAVLIPVSPRRAESDFQLPLIPGV